MRRAAVDRGIVILAVMVLIVIAVLGASTLIHRTGSELAAAQATLRRTQARAAAWSGVQAAMAELSAQRDGLIQGAEPRLTESWVMGEDGVRPVRVRLVVIGERVAEPEAAKVNLNTASEAMLAGLPGVGAEGAAKIVAARGGGRLSSVEDLVRLGIVSRDAFEGFAPASEDRGGGSVEPAPALRSLVTASSFDPNVQCGLGERGGGRAGQLRINLNIPWSDSLARAIDDRFGSGASEGVKGIIERGNTFKSRRDMASFMRRAGIPITLYSELLDAFTAEAGLFTPGLIDLNTAPVEVLACIPGIDEEKAAAIVGRREMLDEVQRASLAWPLELGIVNQQGYEEIVDHVTTRTLQWRIRVEAGVEAVSEDGFPTEDVLRDRVVLEAVIDVGSSRPRVSYLREVTSEGAATRLRASARRAEEPAREGVESEEPVEEEPPGSDASGARSGSGSFGSRSDRPPEAGGDGNVGERPRRVLDPVRPSSPMEEAAPDPPVGSGDNRSGRWTTGGPS